MQRRSFIAAAASSAAASLAVPGRPRAQRSPFQPDGAGIVARFGVLTPDFDPAPESELWAMVPRGISIHTSRVARGLTPGAGFVEPPHIDEAIDRLVELAPKAILVGYTSSSYALGAEEDRRLRARLEERAKGTPLIFPCDAALTALRQCDVQRLTVVHPPWWSETANEQGRAYWRAAGFDVLECARLQPPRSITEVPPREVLEFVLAHTPRAAQAVFIGGNGLRAVGTIEQLERILGKPVLSANQIILWKALSMLGRAKSVTHYGRIFRA